MGDFDEIEPVFQSILDRIWAGGTEDTNVFNRLSTIERAIYSTRVLEGQLDNGGWYQAFFNRVDHLVEPAIEGYQFLGLPEYATHLRDVRAAGFGEDSWNEVGETLDEAYFRLSGSEAARAAALKRDRTQGDG